MQIEVELPTPHADQRRAAALPGRFRAFRCGRRWGKTTFGEIISCEDLLRGEIVGYFVPANKFRTEVYNDIARMMAPVISSSSKTDAVIRTITGGRIDFWTLEDERAGRSRHYDRVIIDEAAFGPPHTMDAWEKSIKPTLLDRMGSAIVLSNTKGADKDNFFWRICNEPEHGFSEYHAPTEANPDIPERQPGQSEIEWRAVRAAEFERIRRETPALAYEQEYLAEFVEWGGAGLFEQAHLLVDGAPVEWPNRCDTVLATIDTAVKTGTKHDGTAVVFWAYNSLITQPLFILDWDCRQIEGALLEEWLPGIFAQLEQFARQCGARYGSSGAFIEDASAGSVLLQHARRRGWRANGIDGKLTTLGKDARALSVSRYVYRGDVKITQPAFDKRIVYKGRSENHLLSQVCGFRIGESKPLAEDDLLDCFCYGVAITRGGASGAGKMI